MQPSGDSAREKRGVPDSCAGGGVDVRLGPSQRGASLGREGPTRGDHWTGDSPRVDYPLGQESLLVMSGACQARHRHGVPRTAVPTGERVSLTFRRILAAGRGARTPRVRPEEARAWVRTSGHAPLGAAAG